MAMVSPWRSGAKPMARWNAREPGLSGLTIRRTWCALRVLTRSKTVSTGYRKREARENLASSSEQRLDGLVDDVADAAGSKDLREGRCAGRWRTTRWRSGRMAATGGCAEAIKLTRNTLAVEVAFVP